MESSSQISSEIKKISDKSDCCSKEDYNYSSGSLTSEGGNSGFPLIDQVIYREWHESIPFKETSTVFYRVDGNIKWYKSKSNNNKGNPIFIDGELNEEYWEPIIECAETNVFSREFVYSIGAQEFTLDLTPSGILLVSINGQGPLKKIDYSLDGSVVTILPPNELSDGDEITVIGVTGGIQIESGNKIHKITWSTGDGNTFNASFNIHEVEHLFINGIDYDEDSYLSFTQGSSAFEITNVTLEEGDFIKLVYKSSVG